VSVLVASDLDRTLIYSRGALTSYGGDGDVVPVERYQGADASWMTAAAARTLAAVAEHAVVVPVTTRTAAQYRRVRLPGPSPRYAVAGNGATLMVDGVPDDAWTATVRGRLAAVAPLDEVWQFASRLCRPEWTRSLRNADGVFCYAVLERDRMPAGALAEAAAWSDGCGWQLSLQGRKLYWVPRPLTKSAAVAEIARRCDASTVLAAGDSLLDADLLEAADRGIAARHGELVASGWRAAHVEVTAAVGVAAGAEIVDWFARALTAPSR
jgi:hypothetical protein